MIFHLSYDFKETETEDLINDKDQQCKHNSLNHHTPREICSVHYNDLDHAVRAYLQLKQAAKNSTDAKKTVFGGKTDIKSAFRLIPLKMSCWRWLILKVQDPISGQWRYFVDKCLPFGASISCAIFQRFSNALKHLIEYKTKSKKDSITNYLDDFLFIALSIFTCNDLIEQFLLMCRELGIPIAEEKTEWADVLVTFLGILLDGKNMTLCLPIEKKERAIKTLCLFVHKKKATVQVLQELCGYLNFLCKAIFPGRPFIRRMNAKYSQVLTKGSNLKPYHHVRLDAEFKVDCNVWLNFLDDSGELSNSCQQANGGYLFPLP